MAVGCIDDRALDVRIDIVTPGVFVTTPVPAVNADLKLANGELVDLKNWHHVVLSSRSYH